MISAVFLHSVYVLCKLYRWRIPLYQEAPVNVIMASTMKTARHAPMATTMRPFLLYARKIAVSSPAAAETMLFVA